ncbi:MAG: hypothetical protein ABIJ75_07135 [Actinomycetota bacterium]
MAETQSEKVERFLRAGWTCGTTLLAERVPRYSARISEINRRLVTEGAMFTVERRRCTREWHGHDTVQYEWRIPG